MMYRGGASKNPFGATKANDLDDVQIQELWVDVIAFDDEIGGFAQPNGYMPTFILGGKGSGKTHLMRYHSFELQMLRFGVNATGAEIRAGIARDGYLGIYALCGSINSSRFNGKGQSQEKWIALFAYYLELWLAHHLLHIVDKLQLDDAEQAAVCTQAIKLFDKRPSGYSATSVSALIDFISELQRGLDYQVTNAVMTGRVDLQILVTRGKLLFGLPKLLSEVVPCFQSVLFLYCIDEFENLTEGQQQVVNSFVRDKCPPSTLRVGSRLYGVKTHRTDGGAEENLRESEFRQLVMDRVFRQHKDRYAKFARSLVAKRIEMELGRSVAVEAFFESVDESWGSEYVRGLCSGIGEERIHFKQFRSRLSTSQELAKKLITDLRSDNHPLLEKLNILLFYQQMGRNRDWSQVAKDISEQCRSFLLDSSQKSKYRQSLEHYKADLLAQLNRENGKRQLYLGLDTFVSMSAGLPRALLTTLRSIFEWSIFQGEDPLRSGKISVEAQYRGVRDATAWFFDHMRKAGDEGATIQRAVNRLGRLFRINRFGERPIEVSLSAFTVDPNIGSPEAYRTLNLAEERSFLVAIPDGGKHKNSGDPLLKYQISPMLAPRWDLPISRRGTVTLTATEFNAIFETTSTDFEAVVDEWTARTSAFAGKPPTEQSQRKLL